MDLNMDINEEDLDKIKETNRQVVEKYLKYTKGKLRLERHNLYSQEAEGGLWTTETGEPIIIRGIKSLERHAHWSLQCFPDWEWYNIKIFVTDNPNHIWVECDGRGIIRFTGYPERYYENHFIHSFELENGLIIRNREFMNPIMQLKALDIEVALLIKSGIGSTTPCITSC